MKNEAGDLVMAGNGPWGIFQKPGINRFLTVFACLKLWIDAIEFSKVGSKDQWANAVLDVVWVLQGLMQATPKCMMYVIFWIAWFWPNKLYIANAPLNQ